MDNNSCKTDKKLHICMVLPCALPVPAVKGGAVETLAEIIAKYNEVYKECNLTIVTIWDKDAKVIENKYTNVKWIHIKKNYIVKYSDYFFRAVRKLTKKSLRLSLYDYLILNKLKNKKFHRIIFEGGNEFFLKNYTRYFEKEILYYHFHSIYRPNYEINSYIGNTITISQYLNDEFLKSSSFKEKKTNILMNGIELEKFSKSISQEEREAIRESYGLQEKDFTLIYVGRIIKDKGILELIDVMKRIGDKNIKLLIAGKGTGFNSSFVNHIISEINKSDQIKYLGYIPNDQLYKIYGASDCFIMPSICEEGAGLVQTEAYAAGLPAIVSNMGGIPEYTIKGASIIVNNDSCFIENLIKAINEMKIRVESGCIDANWIKKKSKNFSAESYYFNYMKIIKNI